MKLTRKNIVWCVFAVLFFIAVGVAFYSYQNGDFDKYKYHFDDEFRAKVDSFNLCNGSVPRLGMLSIPRFRCPPVTVSFAAS